MDDERALEKRLHTLEFDETELLDVIQNAPMLQTKVKAEAELVKVQRAIAHVKEQLAAHRTART